MHGQLCSRSALSSVLYFLNCIVGQAVLSASGLILLQQKFIFSTVHILIMLTIVTVKWSVQP